MSQKAEFHNLEKPDDGLLRELAAGVSTRIFAGEHRQYTRHRFGGRGIDAHDARMRVRRAHDGCVGLRG